MPLLGRDERLSARKLADWYPYFWQADDGVHWENWADEAVPQLEATARTLDPVAILSVLSFEYVCADRTLVQGLSRLPWLGQVDGEGAVRTEAAPPHAAKQASPKELAAVLVEGLNRELRELGQGASKVYLLLSGGMDSRVMAGLVHGLVQRGEFPADVEAVTWGVADCRDVVYGRRIAELFGWKWQHLELDAEHYWRNFETAATSLGAELDPKHLHRMTWFEQAEPGALVLAASYGDSIGRAEYSSVHLANVKPLEPRDWFSLLRPDVRQWCNEALQADIASIRGRYGNRSEVGWCEIERQAHYMRRQLCHPMCIINRWGRIEQLFASPSLFGEVWKYDPSARTDEAYRELLQSASPELLQIPWARTAAPFGSSTPGNDGLRKSHHRYGYWLRTTHASKLEKALFNGALEQLGVFDMSQLRFMFREWQRERAEDDTRLATQLSYLATVAMFAERFGLRPPRDRSDGLRAHERVEAEMKRLLSRGIQVAKRTTRPLRVRKRPPVRE